MSNDLRERLYKEYGFHFPNDFWRFWEFVGELKKKDLETPFLGNVGIRLTGPFDVLNGGFEGEEIHLPYYLHYRYYMDPPEFFTILTGEVDGLHWGYWCDDPGSGQEDEFVVAEYYSNDAFEISEAGKTIFEAVRLQLESQYRANLESVVKEPNDEEYFAESNTKLDAIREILISYETMERKETGKEYEEKYSVTNYRIPTVQTPEGMGIVAPSERYSDNYGTPDGIAKKDVKAIVQTAMKALEDGYPGCALRIGKELWSYGKKFRADAFKVLAAAYGALDRKVLADVLAKQNEYRNISDVDIRKYIGNEYSTFEEAFADPEGAGGLNMYRQKLEAIPEEIGKLQNLVHVNLFHNKIPVLPKGLFTLSKCTELILAGNPITEIPDEIEKLTKLRRLSLDGCPLTSISDSIFKLHSLKDLGLREVPLSEERMNEIKARMPWTEVYF